MVIRGCKGDHRFRLNGRQSQYDNHELSSNHPFQGSREVDSDLNSWPSLLSKARSNPNERNGLVPLSALPQNPSS